MTIKIEEGKEYVLSDGRPYRFLMHDEVSDTLIGVYLDKNQWIPVRHNTAGQFYGPDRTSTFDLMEKPEVQGWYITVRRRLVSDAIIYVENADKDKAIACAKEQARDNPHSVSWEAVVAEYQAVST